MTVDADVTTSAPPYALVTTSDDLVELAARCNAAEYLGFDTEFSGPTIRDPNGRPGRKVFLDPFQTRLAGFSVATPAKGSDPGWSAYVPLRHDWHGFNPNAHAPEALAVLNVVLGSGKPVWAHYVKGELRVLANEGLDVTRVTWRDSLVLAWLLNKGVGPKGRLGLKALAAEHLGHVMTTYAEATKGFDPHAIHTVQAHVVGPYAADDARCTLALGQLWEPEARKEGVWRAFVDLEMPLVPVLRHMEDVGIGVDDAFLADAEVSLTALVGACEEAWFDLTKTDIARTAACADRMYNDLAWWPTRGLKPLAKSGAWPMDAATLEALGRMDLGPDGRAALELRLRWAEASKLLGTYVTRLRSQARWYPDGRIRPSWNQTAVDTGRLSCSGPNLMNQPGSSPGMPVLRRAFRARPGFKLVVADQSQLEPRMLAHLSKDPALLAVWAPDGPGDVYLGIATDLGITRAAAKVVFLAVSYGMAPGTLAARLGLSYAEGKAILDRFWAKYSAVAAWCGGRLKEAQTTGRVRTLTNRFRALNLAEPEWRVANQARNTPVQGSAADVMKMAMIKLHRRWVERGWLADGTAAILVQCHDELVCEVRENRVVLAGCDVRELMENAWGPGLLVPLKAEPKVVDSWDEGK